MSAPPGVRSCSARFMDWCLVSCGFELGDGPEPTPPRRDPRTCGFPARCRGAPPGAEGLLEGVLVGKERLPQSPRSGPRSSWRVPGRPSRLVVSAGNVTMRSEIRRVPPLRGASPGARLPAASSCTSAKNALLPFPIGPMGLRDFDLRAEVRHLSRRYHYQEARRCLLKEHV
jgi:hypothetical protein